MADNPNRKESDVDTAEYEPLHPQDRTDPQDMKPAEEWGERLDTGKRIARGGKDRGRVPGANPNG